jgi:hypothetical protein
MRPAVSRTASLARLDARLQQCTKRRCAREVGPLSKALLRLRGQSRSRLLWPKQPEECLSRGEVSNEAAGQVEHGDEGLAQRLRSNLRQGND